MLILASTSPYRSKLLARLGIPFSVIGSNYDERQHDHLFARSPDKCSYRIAHGKAESVFSATPDVNNIHVLAADQIVWMNTPKGPIQFHKPGTVETALSQLMTMRGHTIRSTTSLVLLSPGGEHGITTTEELDVRMFSENEARAYVEKYQPLDCAGSFRMEDPGITLFSAIRGDWTGCQGFPLLKVTEMLRGAGLLPS